jgi:hypothetical protein
VNPLKNMKLMHKGLLVALIHLMLVCSLGAKLLIDRATRPRVWCKTVGYDPYDPLRGRYVSVQLEVDAPTVPTHDPRTGNYENAPTARLDLRDGKLIAVLDPEGKQLWQVTNGKAVWPEPVAYFISESAVDPSWNRRGAELWAEVTIPKKGPPRPIRLALKQPDGQWQELNLR